MLDIGFTELIERSSESVISFCEYKLLGGLVWIFLEDIDGEASEIFHQFEVGLGIGCPDTFICTVEDQRSKMRVLGRRVLGRRVLGRFESKESLDGFFGL